MVRVDGALIDRPKLLGFVGTQTGFESGDRRAALRSTWFPCDPDGLLRSTMTFAWKVESFERYEKSGHLIGKEYFLHAYGPIYVLSAEVVASLAAARNNRWPQINSGEVARRMEGYSGDDLTDVYRDASLNGTRRKIGGKERDETKNV